MENYIRRDSYLEQLINRRGNGLIKVITGIRRCGKSFLLFNLFYDYLLGEGVPEDHIITIALDDDLNIAYRDPAELSRYIRSKVTDQEGMFYIFIDEVQYAISREELKNPESIHLYNVLNGLQRLRNVDIYVTGSNSKMLSKDVMTAFRGRGDSVEVHPLSFKEYYDYVGGDKAEAYEEYALYGGMPLVLFRKTEDDKFKYLSSLFEEVYFKDIIERYQIGLRNVRLNLRQQEETHIMENIMYNELVSRGYSVDVGVVDIFETDAEGKRKKISCEIDFVVNKGRKKYYIQSVLSFGDARKHMKSSVRT